MFETMLDTIDVISSATLVVCGLKWYLLSALRLEFMKVSSRKRRLEESNFKMAQNKMRRLTMISFQSIA